jgi:hypothetical protein
MLNIKTYLPIIFCLLSYSSYASYGDPGGAPTAAEVEYQDKTSEIVNAFIFDQDDFIQFNSGTKKKVRAAFNSALSVMDEIAEHTDIREVIKVALLKQITVQMGRTFDEFTRPYADPVHWNPMRTSIHQERGFQKIGWVLGEVAKRISFWSQAILRDAESLLLPYRHGAIRMPPAMFLLGRDARRSAAAASIAKDIKNAFSREIKQAEAQKVEVTPGAKALFMAIKAMGSSEPMMHGAHNRIVWWGYLGVGVFLFFHPLFEGVIFEPTTFGPLVAGGLYVAGASVLAAARKRNSGLKSYVIIRNLLKKARRLDCLRE